MNDTSPSEAGAGEPSREEMQSALFAQLVLQQTNLAMMLLGKAPHPETGESTRDLEAARLFIDQLEMLEDKTKGNLTREEGRLLQQSLMSLRMAFVEAVGAPPPAAASAEKPGAAAAEDQRTPSEPPGAAAEEEPTKRFSKKY